MGIFRRIFQSIVKSIMWINLAMSRRYSFNKNGLSVPKGPVLFLSNHQLNLDAVRLRVVNNRRIVFVAHEEVYRNPFYRFVAHSLADTVCRSSSKNNISYLKELFNAKKHGLSIGIYPEGGINYFNQSLNIDISIAKLCKKLDIPIMLCNVNGGSFVTPRWAKRKGHNKVIYTYQRLITTDELRAMDVDTLHSELTKYLHVNDYDWQRVKMSKVRRSEPCANLERALCVCPSCREINSLHFTSDNIHCNKCNKDFTIDDYGFVVGAGDIDDLVKWDTLQQETLYQNLLNSDNESLLSYDKCNYAITDYDKYFCKDDTHITDIKLYKDKLIIKSDSKKDVFEIGNMSPAYVEFKNTLQIYVNDKKIRITNDNFPSYIWVSYINVLRKIINKTK